MKQLERIARLLMIILIILASAEAYAQPRISPAYTLTAMARHPAAEAFSVYAADTAPRGAYGASNGGMGRSCGNAHYDAPPIAHTAARALPFAPRSKL